MRQAGVDRRRPFQFKEVCSRKFGRFDVQYGCDKESFTRAKEMLEKMMKTVLKPVLGDDAVVHMAGVSMN